MFKKHFFFLLSAILFIVSLTGCSSTKAASNHIVVYYLAGNQTCEAAISAFKSNFPSITLDEKSFSTPQEMDETLDKELNTNKAPDVVLFTDQTSIDPMLMASKGAFAPLDGFLKDDKTFITENYIKGALDAGKVNNQQIFIPAAFKQFGLFYDKKTADDLNLSSNAIVNADSFFSALQNKINEAANDNSRCALWLQEPNTMLSKLFRISQVPVVSKDNASIQIDEQNLRKIVDWAKMLKSEQGKASQVFENYKSDFAGFSSHAAFILWNGQNLGWDAYGYNTMYQLGGLKDMSISSVATIDGNNTSAYLSVFGAVTKKAASNKSAYTFVRSIIDTTIPKLPGNGMPVNNKIFNNQLLYLMSKNETTKVGGKDVTLQPLTAQLKDRVSEIKDSIGPFSICNPSIENMLEESFAPYLSDSASYEDCFANFKEKIGAYIKK